MAEAGDKVKIFCKDETLEGVLMPEEDPKFVFVKLSSGYNIGIEKKKIKKIDLVKKKTKTRESSFKVTTNKSLPTISILHTGGTIASKVDYEMGGVVASFKIEDLLKMFPELKKIANINSVFISNMMSEDMRFSDYQKIAAAVQKEIKKGVAGVIIGQGTDTLAITAAAMSFIFENAPIPILIVGSQRSSDRGSSDAGMNLTCASEFISKTDYKGVAICMHESTADNNCLIMPGTKTRKLHTSRRDAFKVVNDVPIARINYDDRKITWLNKPKNTTGKMVVKDKFEDKVAIIKTHTHMHVDIFEFLNSKKYRGLVLEGTGIGQAPTNTKENLPIYNELKKFINNGGVVVLTSQCVFGRVHQNIYKNCRRLAEIGVIFGEDMLTETAFIKLAWILGNKIDKKFLNQNMRGEITKRRREDGFLI